MSAILLKWPPKWRIQWHDVFGNIFYEIYSPENLYIESTMMVLLLLFSEIWWYTGHFLNGRQSPHGGNLAWHYSYIYLVWYGVHLCQVSCFYHKMHDSLNFGHLCPRHTECAVPLRCLYDINRSGTAMIAVVPQWFRH